MRPFAHHPCGKKNQVTESTSIHTDPSNKLFQLAADLINHTSRHIFLTGKAGTGKTTFLKYIKQYSSKRTVVVAPTGVAAINAGGVTMHSFFQLPFSPYVPGTANPGETRSTDQHSLFKRIRFFSEKRELLREMELLIIDEVSMVRCDMLDAIDTILRHFRKNLLHPFGGVQVLYIGDLYQLPPVIPQDHWEILKQHYKSPFFFDAKVIEHAPPLYIELKKIYRQSDEYFIDILNRVRNNEVLPEDISLLNERYLNESSTYSDEQYITLTTHNNKADAINSGELNKLPGELFQFEGKIDGEFSDKAFPTEKILALKTGAQVMFIKNDTGELKRYYNGKIGVITFIAKEKICVKFPDHNDEIEIEKETWKNIRYHYNQLENRIDEEELGTFKQYPIRLAWAITIHKSQGLTFEKAIIDAAGSFAPGQVYVALSRCTKLEGIFLRSPIYPSAIRTEAQIVAYAKQEISESVLEQSLRQEKIPFIESSLFTHFDCTRIVSQLEKHLVSVEKKKNKNKDLIVSIAKSLCRNANDQQQVILRFNRHLENLLTQFRETGDAGHLRERTEAAIDYFSKGIQTTILQPLQNQIQFMDGKPGTARYIKDLKMLEQIITEKLRMIRNAGELVSSL